jgi:hypothetical protein
MQTIKTTSGTRTVVTTNQDGGTFSSRLWVNCKANDLGDATLVARKHTSLKGALNWSNKVLAS